MTVPPTLLVLNALVAGAVIIVVLYTLAVFVRCSIELHQLKVETHRLRIAYFRRLAEMRGEVPREELVGVDIVEEGVEGPGEAGASVASSARQAA